jgi:potassium efflux system protein
MTEEDSVEQLTIAVDRAFVFLSRPEVVEQLMVLGVVLVASRVISRVIWWTIDWWLAGLRPTGIIARRLSCGLTGVVFRVIRSASAPILGIVLAIVVQRELEEAGRVTGLLSELVSVFVVLLAAEVVMTALVGGLDPAEERRYRRRFFKPLIVIVVGLMVLDQLADLGQLSRAPVFELFGSPISLGALFVATLGIWFWTDAINLLNTVVVDFVAKHTTLNDGSAEATLMLIRYALILMGVTYGVGQLQLDRSTIAAITGGLSVGVGFGLREVLGNFISGMFLLFERSLRPGDIVEIDGEMGTVERLSVRSTTVRTIDNEEIVLPNQRFFTEPFKTFTGSDEKVRFSVVIMANCENDVEYVRKVLHRAAVSHPDVLADPPPETWVEDQFGNNVVSYRLHMWSASPLAIPRLRSDIVRLVWASFREAGIHLVFPDLELHFNETAAAQMPALAANGSNGTSSHRRIRLDDAPVAPGSEPGTTVGDPGSEPLVRTAGSSQWR